MSAESGTQPRPRLNPFAFPSDTTFRFLLLIVSVVAASLFAFDWLYTVHENRGAELRATLRCQAAAGPIPDAPGQGPRVARFHACLAALHHPRGYWMMGGVGVMLLVALAIYLLLPLWRLRRGRLVPLPAADAPEVVAEFERLAGELSLRRTPQLVWNPLDPRVSGLAFGRVGRRYVAVSGGLVMLFHTDPEVFRAVVLHELSHVRNRDVDETYFTMALWYSFLLVAVTPVLLSLVTTGRDTSWRIVWRLAALVAFVYLLRNAVLRARELYADVRASIAPSGAAGIRRAVAGLRAERATWWRRPLRLHPDPGERTGVLDDFDRLFVQGLWEPFAAGVALTLAFHELQSLIGFYYLSPEGQLWTAALLVAPVAAGVVGLGIWRAAFAARARGTAFRADPRVGLALGAGFLLGEWLSLYDVFANAPAAVTKAVFGGSGITPSSPVMSSAVFGRGIVWILAVVGGMVLYSAWIAAGAELWMTRVGPRLTRWAAAAGVAAAAAVLTVGMGVFFLLHDVLVPLWPVTTNVTVREYSGVTRVIAVGPELLYRLVTDALAETLAWDWPLLPTLALLWIFPLAALLVRRETGTPRWSFVGEGRLADPGPRPRVRGALLAGVAGGVLFFAGILTWRAVLHATVSPARLQLDDFFLGVIYWHLLGAIVVQVAAAAVVAAMARRRPVLLALLAAGVAGGLASVGFVLTTPIASCVGPLSLSTTATACPRIPSAIFVRQVFESVLVPGTVYALAAALVVVGGRSLVLRVRDAGLSDAVRAPA